MSTLIGLPRETISLGLIAGLMVPDGDEYVLTPKGETYLRSWCKARTLAHHFMLLDTDDS